MIKTTLKQKAHRIIASAQLTIEVLSAERILAGVFLIILAPLSVTLLLTLLLLIRKPLYTSQRGGLGGQKFAIFKFTTVATIKPISIRGLVFRMLAAALRRSRLDELPQLMNILRGEMAFIGPRPLLDGDLDAMGSLAPRRQQVLPGLTGLAQVSGGRLLSPVEKLALDLYYIKQRGPLLDIHILCQTMATTITGDHRNEAVVARAMAAYQESLARQQSAGRLTTSSGEAQAAHPRLAIVCAYFWPELLGCAPYMTDLAQTFAHKAAVDVFAAIPHYPSKKHYDTRAC
jgi:lipopolysaccharide/colanic/teichoic acid biosynthesis glycosyltransferase